MQNNRQVTVGPRNGLGRGLLPRDYLGWLLLFFIVGTYTLFGKGQLMALGFLLVLGYGLNFLKWRTSIPLEILIFFLWLIWSFTGPLSNASIDYEMFVNILKVAFLTGLMSFAVAGITCQRENPKLNFFALAIGCCVFLPLSIFNGDFEIGSYTEYHQTKGITGNPNDFAYLILLTIPALLYFWQKNASLQRRSALLALIAFMTLGILASGSRKAFVGFVVLILLWMWMCFKKEILRKPGLAVSMFIILGAVFLTTNYMLANTYMGKRFKTDLVEKKAPMENHIRIMLYQEGFEMIKNNPIFGVGLGNFQALSRVGTESHSDYIEIAACTGIVGFLLHFSIYVL
ncbi:MAG: O-antigen ligase family protein, partial [bacterium]